MSTHEFYFRAPLPDGLDLDPGDSRAAALAAGHIRGLFGARLAAALQVEVDPVRGYVTVGADPELSELLEAVLRDAQAGELERRVLQPGRHLSAVERSARAGARVAELKSRAASPGTVLRPPGEPGEREDEG